MGTVCRIAVMGTRDGIDPEIVETVLTKVILNECGNGLSTTYIEAMLVLGGAAGVDEIAREWASKTGLTYVLFKPAFMVDPDGRHNAVDFRNRRKQMVDNCDVLVVIKRGDDTCFDTFIRRAVKLGKTVIVEDHQYAS